MLMNFKYFSGPIIGPDLRVPRIYLDVVAIGLNPLRLAVFVFSDGNAFLRIVRIRKSFTPFRIPDRPVIAPLVLSIGNIPFQSYPRISPKIHYELPLNLCQVQSGRSKVMKVHGYSCKPGT